MSGKKRVRNKVVKKYPGYTPIKRKKYPGGQLVAVPPVAGVKKVSHVQQPSRYAMIPTIGTDLVVNMNPDIFGTMLAFYQGGKPNEIAGYFDINPEGGKIDWCWLDDTGSSSAGSVEYGTAEVLIAYNKKYSGYPCGQFHTHPGIGVFWSPTDITAQLQTMDELIAGDKENKGGSFYFIVFDQLKWMVTVIDWKDGKITGKENGTIAVNGQTFKSIYYTYTNHFASSSKGKGTDRYYPELPTSKTNTKPFFDDEDAWMSGWEGWNSEGTLDRAFERGHEATIPAKSELTAPWPISEDEGANYSDSYWKGEWSSLDSDYRPLFIIFDVKEYDWEDLFNVIEDKYAGLYYDIVDKSIDWNLVRKWEKM